MLLDGTGGCDGCLNWKHVGDATPNPNDEEDVYAFPPANVTDNNGLANIAFALELIYTNTDWPFKVNIIWSPSDLNYVLLQEARMEASLQQLGKSRADLWQFAGLVALERSLERANRACDLDKWARQQVGGAGVVLASTRLVPGDAARGPRGVRGQAARPAEVLVWAS